MKGLLREFEDSLLDFLNNRYQHHQYRIIQCTHGEHDYFIHVSLKDDGLNVDYIQPDGNSIDLEEFHEIISKSWMVKVKEIRWQDEDASTTSPHSCITIKLDRAATTVQCLGAVFQLGNDYGKSSVFSGKNIFVTDSAGSRNPESLSGLRIQMAANVIKNVLVFGGAYVMSEYGENDIVDHHLHLGRDIPKMHFDPEILFNFAKVNVVTNADNLNTSDYKSLRKRTLEASIDKDGSDLNDDDLHSLSDAIVVYELLQSKLKRRLHISGVDWKDPGSSYVMYNYVRIKTILDTFEEKVQAKYYPVLPELHELNFKCLKDEDEWRLIFNFLLAWPNLLMDVIDLNEHTGNNYKVHLIVDFLKRIALCVSGYYRRIQILTEPRRHLLHVMCARLHLLKAVAQVMLNCFVLLGIKPLAKM